MLAWLRQRSADLAAGAGWLDMTGGATADGKLIAVTRFAGEEGRRGAEDRHERWWADAAADVEGDVTVLHSTDVTAMHAGPDPAAGFVQMVLATVADRPTVERIEEEIGEAFLRWRPDVLGGYRAWLPGGRVLAVDYFTSESEARAGERREPPPEVAAAFPLWQAQMSDVTWFDLAAPLVAVV